MGSRPEGLEENALIWDLSRPVRRREGMRRVPLLLAATAGMAAATCAALEAAERSDRSLDVSHPGRG
jgi:hypothetical protein